MKQRYFADLSSSDTEGVISRAMLFNDGKRQAEILWFYYGVDASIVPQYDSPSGARPYKLFDRITATCLLSHNTQTPYTPHTHTTRSGPGNNFAVAAPTAARTFP